MSSKDISGVEHVYTYKHGKAVCFGSGFEHATQPSKNEDTKAFLCFTFGTDKLEKYWNPYLAPPKGPPLGSKEYSAMVYESWGIVDAKDGFEESCRETSRDKKC